MIGRTVGSYQVVAAIGRGGMGEVFRAHDTKLERDVALKILPADLAGDGERLARFRREAKVLAALQHQNIAAIYGIEEADGRPVLVMELAAGEDLSERLHKGPLPANELDRVARQMARGLEYAHERGIIHRDLKPANVKVAGDGVVKILDFGLARAYDAESVGEGAGASTRFEATITQALTGAGTVLGTAAYMSPEQARGYEVDRRSDIWAFGAILYEMMTGVRLFEGETAADTLAAVLQKQPDWTLIEGAQPPLLVQLCKRCLEKDPRQRLRDIGEARVALEGGSSSVLSLSASAAQAALPAPPRWRSHLPWLASAVAVLALAAVLWAGKTGRLGPAAPPPALVQASVRIPTGLNPGLAATAPGPLRVSPDGRYLCYAATDSIGRPRVFVRSLADGWTRALSGDGGAVYPFWSADSREVAFLDGTGNLVRAPVNGGPAVLITGASNMKGGSWNQNDQVIFAPTHNSSIMLVAATGGDPVDVTHLDRDQNIRSHRFPQWLPDGRHFLYLAVTQDARNPNLDSVLRVGDAATGESRDVMPVQTSVRYAAGHLLYVIDGLLMARPFDARALEPTGPAVPVVDGVMAIRAAHVAVFDASDGVLSYMPSSQGQGLVDILRFTPDGEPAGTYVESVFAAGFDFAPDGRSICVTIPDARTGTMDLWRHDLDRGIRTRLTFGTENEWFSVFAPDGTWFAAVGDQLGHSGIYRYASQGGAAPIPLVVDNNDNFPGDFAPDGRLYYVTTDSSATARIAVLDPATGESELVHPDAAGSERSCIPSPNGRWLAFSSDESGSFEVYVEGLAGRTGRWRVSAEGGGLARWSRDGDALYFIDRNLMLIRVAVTETDAGLALGAPKPITRAIDTYYTGVTFTVDPRTGDLAVMRPADEGAAMAMELVTNWTRLLGRGRSD